MLSSNLKSQKGFTLIELMIVVAIIGILSAIAIPNFLAFRMKAKASEAKSNLGSIRTCEEAYKTEHEVYLVAAVSPRATTALSASSIAWATNTGYTAIGFAPAGNVFYTYEVTGPATAGYHVSGAVETLKTQFEAFATGDLDADGTNLAVFYVTESNDILQTTATAAYY